MNEVQNGSDPMKNGNKNQATGRGGDTWEGAGFSGRTKGHRYEKSFHRIKNPGIEKKGREERKRVEHTERKSAEGREVRGVNEFLLVDREHNVGYYR